MLLDVGLEEANKALIDRCVARFGAVHVFFANAGVSGAQKTFWDTTADEWNRTLRVNCVGVGMGFKYAALQVGPQPRNFLRAVASRSLGGRPTVKCSRLPQL